ncbi:MAG: Ni/Fe-hydrogenase, b-type cytochrome subunit [Leptospiraceae bacterium]|nr:Ni/Fe-hydrogenase, b-type cytochrome subunit [Leptospiraceae bacterium]MDW7976340.1 Ni/Fe-hydrogenase, b-type cytochrome subunit [Leptospiraceae bacterium]
MKFERKYVWEWPVRLFHWINVFCIVGLTATGFIIGNPPAVLSELEASQQFWFGTVRMIHFILAYVLVLNFVFRFYWGVVGNEYAKIFSNFPRTKEDWEAIKDVLRTDILLVKLEGRPFVGHNPVAYLSYWVFFFLLVFQTATGFAYYSQMSDAWFPQLFSWVTVILGGEYNVRFLHHITTWFFIIFAMIHVYIAAYHDYVEGTGIISSMISGWKFIPKKETEKE